MSPTKREREYARRRYEKWQEKQAVVARQQREARRRALIALTAVAATLAVIAAVLIFGPDRSPSPEAAGPSPEAAAADSPAASSDPNNPCAVPGPANAQDATWPTPPPASLAEGKTWNLAMESTCGPIALRLDGAKAPQAVASAIFLARNGFWDNTRCHRLTTEGIYVLQCGDPTGTGGGGPGYSYGPVENAPADNLYKAGTVAMARQGDKGDSMGSQFFLVYKDSTIPSDSAGGYSVIGTIVGGMATVEKVAAGGVLGGGSDGAPSRAVSITSTTVS